MFVNETSLCEDGSNDSLVIKTASTFIIVDWDDTLLPTSWLTKNDVKLETYLIPEHIKEDLRRIDQAVVEFLRKASVLYGRVLIITNAQPQWIELSSQKFLPETHQLLFTIIQDDSDISVCSFSSSSSAFRNQELNLVVDEKKSTEIIENTVQVRDTEDNCNIKMFSARELFEKDYPDDPSAWKKTAFKKLLKARISSKFFIPLVNTLTISKSYSESEVTLADGKTEKRGLKRSLSAISLSTTDLRGLVELENESYEVETEFKDNDSIFSLDFSPAVATDSVELEWANVSCNSPKKEDIDTGNKVEGCNLISIGDCCHDTQSLAQLDIGLDSDRTMLKTVKLIDFPSIRELLCEIEGLTLSFDRIVRARKSFDLFVDKKKLL